MARITVVKPDHLIMIDSEGYYDCDVSFLDDNIHAIQWYHTYGEIERRDERNRCLPNEEIFSLESYEAPLRAAWAAKKAENEAALAALNPTANG